MCRVKCLYREVVAKWNSVESHDLFDEPSVLAAAGEARLLLSACDFPFVSGYSFIEFVIELSLVNISLFGIPRTVSIIQASGSLHHPSIDFTPSEQLHEEASLKKKRTTSF